MLSVVSSSSSEHSQLDEVSEALINQKLPSDIFQRIFSDFFEREEYTPLFVCQRWKEEYLYLMRNKINHLKGVSLPLYPPLYNTIHQLQVQHEERFFYQWKHVKHSISQEIRKIPLSVLRDFVSKSPSSFFGFEEVENLFHRIESVHFSLSSDYSPLIKSAIDDHQWLWALEMVNDFVLSQNLRDGWLKALCEKLVAERELEKAHSLASTLSPFNKEEMLYLIAQVSIEQCSFEVVEKMIPNTSYRKDALYHQIVKRYLDEERWEEAFQTINEKIEDVYCKMGAFQNLFIRAIHKGYLEKAFFKKCLACSVKDANVLNKGSLHENLQHFFNHLYEQFEIQLIETVESLEQMHRLEELCGIGNPILSLSSIVCMIKWIQLEQIDRALDLMDRMLKHPDFPSVSQTSFQRHLYLCELIQSTAKHHLIFAEKILDHLHFLEYSPSLCFTFIREAFLQGKQEIVWNKLKNKWNQINPIYYVIIFFAEKWMKNPEEDFNLQEIEQVCSKIASENFYQLAYHLTDLFASNEDKHLFFFRLIQEYLEGGKLSEEAFFLEQITQKQKTEASWWFFSLHFGQMGESEKALHAISNIKDSLQKNHLYVKLFNICLQRKEIQKTEEILEKMTEKEDRKKCSQKLFQSFVYIDLELAAAFLECLNDPVLKKHNILRTLVLLCDCSLGDSFFAFFQKEFDGKEKEVIYFLFKKAVEKKNFEEAFRIIQEDNFPSVRAIKNRLICLLVRYGHAPEALHLMGEISIADPDLLLELAFLLEGTEPQKYIVEALQKKSNHYQPLLDHKILLQECMKSFRE